MHICMYVRMYAYVCMYVCVYMCMHASMCVGVRVCTCVYVCMYVCVRGGVDKSLAPPNSPRRRTESIVSLERGVCSCAELQVSSCYRG